MQYPLNKCTSKQKQYKLHNKLLFGSSLRLFYEISPFSKSTVFSRMILFYFFIFMQEENVKVKGRAQFEGRLGYTNKRIFFSSYCISYLYFSLYDF